MWAEQLRIATSFGFVAGKENLHAPFLPSSLGRGIATRSGVVEGLAW
jgi:hypothetical protein